MSTAPDFGQYAAESATDDTPVPVPMLSRDGEPYQGKGGPTVFQVVGEYSEAYRKGDKRVINKTLRRARQGEEIDADEIEETGLERCSYAVVSFENVEDRAGNPVSFSRQNVIAFLTAAPWNVAKVEQAIKGHARFFKRASAS
jgi:hypothetical protein